MNELLKQTLNEYFSDFKKYHLIILICFAALIALLQILQTYILSTKIEKFKAQLKKSEIRFSKYNELQISALRKIYHQLATFQLANNLIFNTDLNSFGHTKYKTRINEWIRIYVECSSEFAREKILLTQEIKTLFSQTISDFEDVKKILIDEKHNLDYYEMEHSGNWNLMYDLEEDELYSIGLKIGKLKEKSSINNSDVHIRLLREKIEEVFQKME
ncbi:hypothetical protein [Kaistella jeonii]|uniref:Uncharacterized protein n=1 Tax=Kaistella jeonii TaxID=266749 RepID=A0A0C1CGB2_9FLAO|nr:hypothetical protein [Kaistella jeonii]KIA82621.1 hypothetical protein OA86_14985 [Kaistella jeonii]VEI96509.1 Uncharacterised protein [Kaistella jeonii]VEI96524.1 Uncharacterised protein [Kaistella jeonii]